MSAAHALFWISSARTALRPRPRVELPRPFRTRLRQRPGAPDDCPGPGRSFAFAKRASRPPDARRHDCGRPTRAGRPRLADVCHVLPQRDEHGAATRDSRQRRRTICGGTHRLTAIRNQCFRLRRRVLYPLSYGRVLTKHFNVTCFFRSRCDFREEAEFDLLHMMDRPALFQPPAPGFVPEIVEGDRPPAAPRVHRRRIAQAAG
jgi:hypothetical protein